MKTLPVKFTAREIEAVAMLAEGRTANEIATAAGRSEETIRSRTERARHKVGAPTAACLVNTAYRQETLSRPALEDRNFTITARQQRGLELLALGVTNAQAAAQLGVSEQTVIAERRALRELLGARNHAHMIRRAWALGLLT